MKYKKRLKLIACEVLFREICHCAARCSNIVDITFVEKGLTAWHQRCTLE
ncbi:MAG: hypothetical protein GX936_06815 [Clostridiales bacterium]|jgi:hypothetical protein|nr:hypothetical protein [Clostridiales bacterium]